MPSPAQPKAIRPQLPYKSADEFIQKYAGNIIKNGIFVPTKTPFPVGTAVEFTFLLEGGAVVFQGAGSVADVKPFDPAQPQARYGMALQFTSLSPQSQTILERTLVYKQSRATGGTSPSTPAVMPGGPAAMPSSLPGGPSAMPGPAAAPTRAGGFDPVTNQEHSGKMLIAGAEQLKSKFLDIPADIPRVGPIIGIDLGTTNSCAAIVENGRPIVIPSRRGYNTIPSMVAFSDKGKLLVGHMAKNQFLLNPANTVYGSKRLIGRKYKSPLVQGLKNYFTYEIVEAPDGSVAVRVGGHTMTLPEVSALILKEIKEIAQEYLGQEVTRCVITVPAYYNDNQRNAVRLAGRMAGMYVERIVNEPTAAALAYGFGKGLNQRVLIYDLGGGTFDASVLDLSADVYEVVSTGGNNFLGGIDFDNRLTDYFDEEFHRQCGIPLPKNTVIQQRVKFAAETAKIQLSERPTADVHVPFIHMHNGKPLDLKLTVTREKLCQLTEDLVDRTLAVCEAVLAAKGLAIKDIDEVLLVGGQSRFPLVWEKLEKFFGRLPHKGVHPDEVVALGAGLLAHSIEGDGQRKVVLHDVLPISIGLALPGGKYARIVPRNTPLPFEKRFTIATTRDNQTEIKLVVLQGESEKFGDNDYLGTLRFDGIQSAPKGQNKLQVTFELNNEGLLTVKAKDHLSGKEMTAVMTMKDVTEEVGGETAGGPGPVEPMIQDMPAADSSQNLPKAASPRAQAAPGAAASAPTQQAAPAPRPSPPESPGRPALASPSAAFARSAAPDDDDDIELPKGFFGRIFDAIFGGKKKKKK